MNRTSSVRHIVHALPSRLSAFFLFTAVLLVMSGSAFAQLAGKGAVSGTIEDPTGAAVPGATIVVTNSANGIATSTTSTSAGDYSVSTLDPGVYTISVPANRRDTYRIGVGIDLVSFLDVLFSGAKPAATPAN